MDYRAIKTLKGMVEVTLQEAPETRNSDITLTIEIWRRFFPQAVKKGSSGREGVLLSDLYHLPREDNVKRIRAYFQNDEKKYFPTDWKIAFARGIAEQEWKIAMGYAKPTVKVCRQHGDKFNPTCEICNPNQQKLI